MFKPKRIRKVLVYGANGVQGSAIARQLHEEGFEVRAAVRDPAKAASLSAAGIGPNTALFTGTSQVLARELHRTPRSVAEWAHTQPWASQRVTQSSESRVET